MTRAPARCARLCLASLSHLLPAAALAAGAAPGGVAVALTLSSSSFKHQGEIPSLYTCEGRNISPPLSWSGIPGGAKSLALIVDDPDAPDPKAPKMTFVHWVLYNVPPTANGLAEGVPKVELPAGAKEGINDGKRPGYTGPCPPIGRHRYFFKLYALDAVLPDLGVATKPQLEKAMEGHVLAKTELMGTYQKKK